MKKQLMTLALISMFSFASSHADQTYMNTTTVPIHASGATEASAGPSDPEICHIVVTANNIDIAAGKMAKGKTKNKEVKAFAQEMITDHTAVKKQATDLAKKLKVTPADNDISKSLKTGADESNANLKKLKGADFDKQYVDHEVAYHEAVLNEMDQTLIPNAKNEELKALITKVRPSFNAHLEHAKMLQSKLNGSST